MTLWETFLWWFILPVGWLTIAVFHLSGQRSFLKMRTLHIGLGRFGLRLLLEISHPPSLSAFLMYTYTHNMKEGENLLLGDSSSLFLTAVGAIMEELAIQKIKLTFSLKGLLLMNNHIRIVALYLLVLAGHPAFADDAEEKRDAFYERLSYDRQAMCHLMAKEIHWRYSTPNAKSLLVYDKLAPAFCKWCKDLDKDHYRAVCPK